MPDPENLFKALRAQVTLFSVCRPPTKRTTPTKQVILRLGFNGWLKLWLNDTLMATLRHDDSFAVAEAPITLGPSENRPCLKLRNFDNVEWRC